MKVPVPESPAHQRGTASPSPKFIIPTTEGYRVDWIALLAFHVAASRDSDRPAHLRAWHARQARSVRARHEDEASEPWSWQAFTAQALERMENREIPLT